MAKYQILRQGLEGRRYVYHCRTGDIPYKVSMLHPLKSERGLEIHLGGGADRAILKASEPEPEPEETFTASEVTEILRQRDVLDKTETFSRDMETPKAVTKDAGVKDG